MSTDREHRIQFLIEKWTIPRAEAERLLDAREGGR